jgi:hypothetical protein
MLTKNPKLRITLSECFTHDSITKEGNEPLVPGVVSTCTSVKTITSNSSGQGGEIGCHMTVTVDESERAIQNIPERIDLSLSQCLEQAHMLVKTWQLT